MSIGKGVIFYINFHDKSVLLVELTAYADFYAMYVYVEQ